MTQSDKNLIDKVSNGKIFKFKQFRVTQIDIKFLGYARLEDADDGLVVTKDVNNPNGSIVGVFSKDGWMTHATYYDFENEKWYQFKGGTDLRHACSKFNWMHEMSWNCDNWRVLVRPRRVPPQAQVKMIAFLNKGAVEALVKNYEESKK